MSKLASTFLLFSLVWPSMAKAQEGVEDKPVVTGLEVSGHFGGLVGRFSPAQQAGGRADVLLGRVGFGVEGGSFGYSPYVSFDGTLRFRSHTQWSPFVRAGSTLISSDSPYLANIGGGVRYRLGGRSALILEVRDHIFLDDPSHHLVGARVAVSVSFP